MLTADVLCLSATAACLQSLHGNPGPAAQSGGKRGGGDESQQWGSATHCEVMGDDEKTPLLKNDVCLRCWLCKEKLGPKKVGYV